MTDVIPQPNVTEGPTLTPEVEEAALLNILEDMREDQQSLENQRVAILNILEDANEAQEKLKEVDRMKTEFVSLASHQLRTPLTAIRLYVEMLANEKKGKNLTEKQLGHIQAVETATLHMTKLVGDLLNITRIELGHLKYNPELIQPIDVIEGVVRDIKPIADERACRVEIVRQKEDPPRVYVDPAALYEVIHNIVTNAVRYSPRTKGRVQISVEKRDEMDLVIAVKDNGIGIPEESRERIFERFYRAKNAMLTTGDGTGLGLYLAKYLAREWKGEVSFTSKENKGTTFFVAIPLTPDTADRQKAESGAQ